MATLKLDSNLARAADNIASGIRETGKYVGVITRAESLKAATGTLGLGLSFRSDNGQTADYLDLYHTKGNGEPLSGLKTVNAIMCCAKVAEATEGTILCEKWDRDSRTRQKVECKGYPALMGKRIGLLLRKVLETDDKGADRERLEVFGVFNAETELTASEMYDRKTNPERLSQMLDALMSRPVIDKRKHSSGASGFGGGTNAGPGLDDDIPFN